MDKKEKKPQIKTENKVEKTEAKKDDLVLYFEDRGYENIEVLPKSNVNDILVAEKDGEKCFIKKYAAHADSSEEIDQKAKTEMECYENLPPDILIRPIDIKPEDGYLVLERVELKRREVDEDFIREVIALVTERFSSVDASFLKKTTWEDYEKIIDELDVLGKAGLISNVQEISQMFSKNKERILATLQIFSHQDFNPLNVQMAGDELKVFDFERARQDIALADLAIMFIDLDGDPDLEKKFIASLEESGIYDSDIFNLMIIKRVVRALYAFVNMLKKNKTNSFLEKNLRAYQRTSLKLLDK